MVLVLPGRKTFGSQFSAAFNPALQRGVERFLESEDEKESEQRKNAAQLDKEERERIAKEKFEEFKTGEIGKRDVTKLTEKQRLKDLEDQKLMQLLGISPTKNIPPQNQEPAQSKIPSNIFGQMIQPGNKPSPQQALLQDQYPQETPEPIDDKVLSPKQLEQAKPFYQNLDERQRAMLAIKKPELARQIEAEREFDQRQDLANQKFKQQQQQFEESRLADSFKENKDFIDSTHGAYEDAIKREAILGRMEALNNSNELTDAGLANFMNYFHIPIESLKNYTNDEYNKLSNDLTAGITNDYGNRILASEFNVMLRRIPTLQNTPEGRTQIIQNMRALLAPATLKEEALQRHLEKSKVTNKPLPHDLYGEILKEIKPQLNAIADDFKTRNGRVKVEPGTALNDDVVDKYLELSRDKKTGKLRPEEAEKMAQEDGYSIE